MVAFRLLAGQQGSGVVIPMAVNLIAELRKSKIKAFCNDNISELMSLEKRETMKLAIEAKVADILDILGIDREHDHNTYETPKRVAKMWVDELFRGRYMPAPTKKSFPNVQEYDGLLLVGPIDVRSTCAHHLVSIAGICYVGIVPDQKVLGLSKYNRIVDWFSRRPQIQEELTKQIASYIFTEMEPKGVAVYIRAKHQCMTHRGVKQNSDTITSHIMGAFRENASLKAEFIEFVKLNETR